MDSYLTAIYEDILPYCIVNVIITLLHHMSITYKAFRRTIQITLILLEDKSNTDLDTDLNTIS